MVSLYFIWTFLLSNPLLPQQTVSRDEGSSFLASARHAMSQNDTDAAFQYLSEAFFRNPNLVGLYSCFEDLFRLKISLNNDDVDRMGLASLLSDIGRYEEAANELREMLSTKNDVSHMDQALHKKARSTLFRNEAAICSWDSYDADSVAMLESVRDDLAVNILPSVHPYEALMWPCLSLEDASSIARSYASRTMGSVVDTKPRLETPERVYAYTRNDEKVHNSRIKVAYISPDFTGVHPLAFLMQDVFRLHDNSRFDIYVYSLNDSDLSPEVEKIKAAASKWTVLSSSVDDMVETIRADGLDMLIDLCGYTGTSLIAEIMARRAAPVQIAYMGFPASSCAPFIDFMICDEIVVPPTEMSIRKHYSESLIYMPHCYFVNSHRYLLERIKRFANPTRSQNSLPKHGFIFCCHSRPDKIDPITFDSWVGVIKQIRDEGKREKNPQKENAILWLLRSCAEMERNLRQRSRNGFQLDDDAIIFADKVSRDEHLLRLQLVDLFLDTPAYNAHTVGVDCLSVGVPMVSLLRKTPESTMGNEIATEKLASRVGASLLTSVGLPELVAPDMTTYQSIMKRCVTDEEWFSSLKERLSNHLEYAPLFDTKRWVDNFESALFAIDCEWKKSKRDFDVFVIEK
ncbi:unnamed protein product [Cylindrotheca closterium]|uniref:O-GlcNAc transferase C-terminal domain-containing protein n=1 Tax=Cylindrotheca closterium TaxID=2856 RepID=A0AAD2CP97_9STRA|nr:unnamed protein product [Cylindrotheca closterium]